MTASSSSDIAESVNSETIPRPQKRKHPGRSRIKIVKKPLLFPPPVSTRKRQYTTRYKLRVLSYLQHALVPLGPTVMREVTAAETARRFKIPACNIARWKKQEKGLLGLLGTQHRNRTGKQKWPAVEQPLYLGFLKRREVGKVVRRGWFRATAKSLMLVHYPGVHFRFSNGWFSGN